MRIQHCLCGLMVMAACAVVQAGSIGINFVGGKPDGQFLAAGAKAGLSEVAQDHWNNLTISKSDPNGHRNKSTLDRVHDDAGQTVPDMKVTVDATQTTQVWPANGASWGFSGADLTLQSGEVYPQPRITISPIPYASYQVILYAAAGRNGGQGSATITVAQGAPGKVDPAGTYFYKLNWQGGKFIVSRAKTLEQAQASKGSNCIRFTGNTAKSITIEWNGKAGGGWTGCSGLQIVELHLP